MSGDFPLGGVREKLGSLWVAQSASLPNARMFEGADHVYMGALGLSVCTHGCPSYAWFSSNALNCVNTVLETQRCVIVMYLSVDWYIVVYSLHCDRVHVHHGKFKETGTKRHVGT